MTEFHQQNCEAGGTELLQCALKQTESECGFIGLYVEGNKFRVLAKTTSLQSNDIPVDQSLEDPFRIGPGDGEKKVIKVEKLLGKFINGEVVSFCANTPTSKGPPFYLGEMPLQSFLGVPIKSKGKTVGMIGLVNRNSEYRKEHRDLVQGLTGVACVLYDCYCREGIETELVLKQQETEDALLESERKLSTLILNLPGMAFRCRNDKKRTMEFLSDGCLRLTGYDKTIFMNENPRCFNDIIHPEDRQLVWETVRTALSNHRFFHLEYRIITRSGAVKWVLEYGVGVFSKGNKLLALEGFILDNARSKRNENELKAQRTFLKHIIDINPNFMFAKDRDGRYTLANRAVAKAYGTTVDNLIGKKDTDFSPNVDEVESFRKADIEVMNTMRDKFIPEEKITDSNGRVRWLQTMKRAIVDDNNQTTLVLGVATDITERKQIEAALENERATLAKRVQEQTAELKAANGELARTAHQKDEFLAMMSHELRTPLNAILGLTEILKQGIHGTLNGKQRRSVEMLEDSGQHLLDLINDILDVAKIGAGKIELGISLLPVKSVSQASLQFVTQEATKKNITFSLDIAQDVNVVRADERRLKQILVNLLSNAVKFTPENGRIGLSVTGDSCSGQIHFTVWDTGIGIASDVIDRLFLPFTQVDSSFTRPHEGTGLGLSLVLRLTEMHGGNVSVESKEGEGSRFRVTLPWQEDKAELLKFRYCAEVVKKESGKEGIPRTRSFERSFTILLAEDNEDNIEVVREYLQFNKYKVIEARNGIEALERAAEFHPDLVLMDIQMPEMDGLEAIKRLRSDGNFIKTPIIALTALAMPGDRELCLAAGANAYLTKPVKLRELAEMIDNTLRTNRHLEPAPGR